MLRDIIFYTLVGLLGACAFWYLIALKKWTRVLGSPDFQELSEAQRASYMATPEYSRLRGAARLPIALSLLLFAAIYLVMRNPF